jgi:transcriptional regulator with XRE-family HTH domain
MERELRFLQDLCAKHGADYIRKYFGFTLEGFADRLGIKKAHFSNIVHGRKPLSKKHSASFLKAFQDFRVEEKVRDFKPTETQTWLKTYWAKQKNNLTILLLGCMLITMKSNTPFFKTTKENGREYIRRYRRITCNLAHSIKTAFVILTSAVFFIFNIHTTKNRMRLKYIFDALLIS